MCVAPPVQVISLVIRSVEELGMTAKRYLQRGLSLVELMVGIAIGLFVVGGAITLTVGNLGSNRTLMLETRVNQDVRAAADVVARELRRTSYWQDSLSGLWSAAGTPVSTVNPYGQISNPNSAEVGYSYERPGVVPTTAELGFKRVVVGGVGVIQLQDGPNGWQTLTDSKSVNIQTFSIQVSTRTVSLWRSCSCRTRVPVSSACTDTALAASATTPRIHIRSYSVSIIGQAVADARITRRIDEVVRAQNDLLTNPNGCPSS